MWDSNSIFDTVSFVWLYFYCVCLISLCYIYSFIFATIQDGEIKLYITENLQRVPSVHIYVRHCEI